MRTVLCLRVARTFVLGNVVIREIEMAKAFDEKKRIDKGGAYFLAVANCGDSDGVRISGQVRGFASACNVGDESIESRFCSCRHSCIFSWKRCKKSSRI